MPRNHKPKKNHKKGFARHRQRLYISIVTIAFALVGTYIVITTNAQATGPDWGFSGPGYYSSSTSGSTITHTRGFDLTIKNPAPRTNYQISWNISVDPGGTGTTDAVVTPTSGTTTLSAATRTKTVYYSVRFTRGCYQVYFAARSNNATNTNSYPRQIGNGHAPGAVCGGSSGGGGGTGGTGGSDKVGRTGGTGTGTSGPGSGPSPAPSPTPSPSPQPSPAPSPTPSPTPRPNSTAMIIGSQPNSIPTQSPQGASEQPPKIEPSPFYDGKEYEPGSDADGLSTFSRISKYPIAIQYTLIAAAIVAAVVATGYYSIRRRRTLKR